MGGDEAHALVVLTEWDEFKKYPYHEFYAHMMKPACLFDGRGILNHKALEDIGFEVHAIGKGRGPDGKLRVLAQPWSSSVLSSCARVLQPSPSLPAPSPWHSRRGGA